VKRKGDWLQTLYGGVFYPLDPRPEEVDIHTIAGALAKLCRYGGHCSRFYSVAEHSMLVAQFAPPHLKREALLHDAGEAYLVDVPRPIKPHLAGYKGAEQRLERVIYERFGLDYPLAPVIKMLDDMILVDERDQNMAKPPKDWGIGSEGLGAKLRFLNPHQAQYQFLCAWQRYGGKL
jgi:uncharacterized protein